MDTIEHYSDFLRSMGTPNFLAIGIALIVIWLLISGIRRGLKRRKGGDEDDDGDNPQAP